MQDFSTISICLSADENYIWHLVETIWSIRKVSFDRKTDVYVLLDCKDDKSYDEISSEIVRFSTKTLNIIPIDTNKDIPIEKSRVYTTKDISVASYVRLFLPTIFPMLDRILWLDCDLIVRKPLDEFWDIDIGGKYAAACDDVTMKYAFPDELVGCKVNRYFNAGVILMNLAKIREDGIDKEFIRCMYDKKPRFQDQTILNTCFKENVVWLPQRFNLHYSSFANRRFREWTNAMYGETYVENSDQPTIVHFTGVGTKPWQEHPATFYFNEYIRNASEAMHFIMSSSKCNFGRIRMEICKVSKTVKFQTLASLSHIPKEKKRRIFVCLTSYPARIGTVSNTIGTLVDQSIKPDGIFLTLAKDEFPKGEKSLPETLMNMILSKTVTLNWVPKNTKTMKKLFPVLNRFEPEDLLIIVDDDIMFSRNFIKTRLDDFYKFGERFAISGTHRIWERTHCIISSAGTMIERRMLDGWEDFIDDEVIRTYEDDWAYTFVMLLNGCQFVACSGYSITDYAFKNMAPSRCYETRKTIRVMLDKYKKRHPITGRRARSSRRS